MRKWSPITLTFYGEELAETGDINPFLDFRLQVIFRKGSREIVVPGYFAADGNAAETSATSGNVWRVHFLPDEEGEWSCRVSFRYGDGVAVSGDPAEGTGVAFDGVEGRFRIGAIDPLAQGFFAKGRLDYIGERYLRFAETGEAWLKGGADSPENFLAYVDFDDTTPTHHYEPHARDWRSGDPTWKNGKGKSIIGALNYLASKKMNSVYFLTMNVNGDGRDVWPWISSTIHDRYDCSKLDQWNRVFEHMDRLGVMMHVVHQEQENDQLLDGGELGIMRKLYYRELIARFAHHPALIWNLGEENTNTRGQRKAFAQFIRNLDPYDHPIVIHTYPNEIDEVYADLLGFPEFEGPSFQFNRAERTHEETIKYLKASEHAGRPWFVCQDEIGPPSRCVPPDIEDSERVEIIRHALWGNLMAGGSGVEWIFAYDTFPRQAGTHLDIACENWRPWDKLWDHTAVALEFFHRYLPFDRMTSADDLVAQGNAWCFARQGEIYAVYVFGGQEVEVSVVKGSYRVAWFDLRKGGELIPGKFLTISEESAKVSLGLPPSDIAKDWVAVLERKRE